MGCAAWDYYKLHAAREAALSHDPRGDRFDPMIEVVTTAKRWKALETSAPTRIGRIRYRGVACGLRRRPNGCFLDVHA
jgi:hypothetical protein